MFALLWLEVNVDGAHRPLPDRMHTMVQINRVKSSTCPKRFRCARHHCQISGVDAARILLADLLSCTDAARGVGELALYWAARAKLEEVSWRGIPKYHPETLTLLVFRTGRAAGMAGFELRGSVRGGGAGGMMDAGRSISKWRWNQISFI